MPGRRQPFSGKQKKEQLQQRRSKRQPHHHPGAEHQNNSGSASDGAEKPQADMSLGGDKKGIRSAFAKESEKEVRARRRLAFQPLTDRRDCEPAIPYGEWFKMAFEGEIDLSEHSGEDEFDRQVRLGQRRREQAARKQPTSSPPQASVAPRVYDWKDAPVSLPLPTPLDAFRTTSVTTTTTGQPTDGGMGEGHTTVEELKAQEETHFAAWVRDIEAASQEDQQHNSASSAVNQYERNLDVWRQLWYTVSSSDVVMLIVDARYPIFHLPLSVVHYVVVQQQKRLLVVLNKSDLLPPAVLEQWSQFLRAWMMRFLRSVDCAGADSVSSSSVQVASMCCTPEHFVADLKEDAAAAHGQKRRKTSNTVRKQPNFRENLSAQLGELGYAESSSGSDTDGDALPTFKGSKAAERVDKDAERKEKERLQRRMEVGRAIDSLLAACHDLRGGPKEGPLRVGLVGHPNVGKSSLINAIRGTKSVSVSATAGHTKHMQTVNLPSDNAILYDCPGLCFPVLGVPRPLQAVLGTHQVAQQRDPASGVAFLARHLRLERIYGLRKLYTEDKEWSAHELCEAYATKRGYRTRGRGGAAADVHRAAIEILQEAYAGRLVLYFAPPPMNMVEELAAFCWRPLRDTLN